MQLRGWALAVAHQHPQRGAVVVWDLDVRPEGPCHPWSPESEQPPLLGWQTVGARC